MNGTYLLSFGVFAVALLGLLAGAAIAWLFRERECVALRSALSKCAEELAASEARLIVEREGFERERAGLRETMLGQFQALAQEALGGVSGTFLELATTKLGQERQTLQGIMAPVQDEFVKFAQAVAALQKNTAEDFGALKTSLEQVALLQNTLQDAVRTTNDATGRLQTALQNPRVAGNWGEINLDRIVELAGMTEHCDFDRQTGVHSSTGTIEKPDLLIHLTGGLHIPVDAKASTANYIRAVGETEEAERKRLLKQSASDLKSRVSELRVRAYDRIEGYAGMTMLFVPNESMLSSALALEPTMIEDALRYNIVICSPLLLLCYLRAFANGWRIQKQQDNAEEVARRGRMLHERLQSFFTMLAKVGKYLNHTVEKYNDCIGKTDNLLVPGRELGKLLGLTDELHPIDSIDTGIREMRTNAEDLPVLAEGVTR